MTSASRTIQPPVSGNIFVGCSGWAYASWKPGFYPPKLAAKKFLEYYASRLNSVEVNYTFRSLPSASIVASWLAATGPDFRFSCKAPQRITHILRLKSCGNAFAEFARSIEPIVEAQRFGVVLLQLPPNFKKDSERLELFLQDAAHAGLRLAFEFRHESWFEDEVYSVLRKHGAALCVAESDDLATPAVMTASFSCYRLRRSNYTAEQLEAVRALLLQRGEAGDVFAYFKHEDEPTGAIRAVSVLEGLPRE